MDRGEAKVRVRHIVVRVRVKGQGCKGWKDCFTCLRVCVYACLCVCVYVSVFLPFFLHLSVLADGLHPASTPESHSLSAVV